MNTIVKYGIPFYIPQYFNTEYPKKLNKYCKINCFGSCNSGKYMKDYSYFQLTSDRTVEGHTLPSQ